MKNSDRSMMPDHTPSSGCLRPYGPRHLRGRFAIARGIGTGALVVLAPKCLFCVAGYLGLASGVGAVGVEMCGSADLAPARAIFPAAALMLSAALLGWRFQVRLRAFCREMKRAVR